MSSYNPPLDTIDQIRTVNLVIGIIGSLSMLVLVRWRWKFWSVANKLGWMSLFLFTVVGTYSTIEIKFLDTYFRVPMVTVALLWAILAAVWPFYESWKRSRDTRSR